MDIRSAIRARHSTRRYAPSPIPGRDLERMFAFAAEAEHLSEPGVRVALVNGQGRVADVLARYRGIYGLVQGAPHLLVGILPQETDVARLDLGYVLEQVVLKATQMGLATCWMTGSYHPDQAAQEVDVKEGEVVAAAVALGTPRQDVIARLHDGAIRHLVAAHRRRPLEEITFSRRWGEEWTPEGADPALVEILECARLAPSAVNRQPWRFIVGSDQLYLALVQPAPIDAGIVMAHVKLAAADLGRAGGWTVRWDDSALAASLDLPPSATAVGLFS